MNFQPHRTQNRILDELRRHPVGQYSRLAAAAGPAAEENFRFHLNRLIRQGYVLKLATGQYSLTNTGKAYANSLDGRRGTLRRRPQVSMLLIVERTGAAGPAEYLLQRRQRQPYWGFWGLLSGPLPYGADAAAAAANEVRKQTGLLAEAARPAGCCRVRDFLGDATEPAEDKVFLIVQLQAAGRPVSDWSGGETVWAAVADIARKQPAFGSTLAVIRQVTAGQAYTAVDTRYNENMY